jgi:hypothetical protein
MPTADGCNEKCESLRVRCGGEQNLLSVAVSGPFDSFTVGEFGDEVSFQWAALNQFDSNELRRKNLIE